MRPCWFDTRHTGFPAFAKEDYEEDLYVQSVGGPVFWAVSDRSGRQSTICSHSTLAKGMQRNDSPGLFAIQNGMTIYIQMGRIPEIPLTVSITYHTISQKCQCPDLVPSEYPNPLANALKYRSVLTSRLGTSDTHNFSGPHQNWVLKNALAS